ncbi:Cytochrome c-type biogenesis protein CcdA (DsbD analog) [hydrothermal vent metagenome]|uniref:Cytochrome c-type biogenesis protein CcdA (DsbD analog) n=1 Tax=hydrothermal vent metagenome TaxID=652676 RepID=A0A3B1ATL2_9ZZZZ
MITLLLLTATVLGLLAFFEPCTIATHTLFSVRLHTSSDRTQCCFNFVSVWISRTLLLSGIFVGAVLIFDTPVWSAFIPSILLSVIAVIYVVSRFIYIPIPHFEFFKFLPKGKKLPYSIQLGLTLPACTLPLIMVTAGMAVTVDSILIAFIAALLFSTLFTLPMAFVLYKGIHSDAKQLLSRAAKISPFLTAILLLGTALVLLIPLLNISSEMLKETLQTASIGGIGIAFITGFVFSFNPVSFASVPVMLAYVTKAHEERRALMMGGAFVLGMIITHIVLGIAAALGGEWVKSVMGREWGLFLGPLLIIMGLVWAGWLNIRFRWFGVKGRKVTGIWGAFLLGIPFSVAVCPFCTPALLVTLTASAAIGSVGFGALLLFAFAIGRSIPVIIGAWSMGWLESLNMLSKHQRVLEVTAGVTLIITGLYLLNEYLFIVNFG